MDPTSVFCPNKHCHARGQTGMGNIGVHSRKEPRFICHECHKTFSATTGTIFQIPSDLVVKFQPIDIIGLISWLA
jgi:transposase-like protein